MVFNGVTESFAYLSTQYENLIRILGNDIPGERKTLIGLTQIRGIGYMFANSMPVSYTHLTLPTIYSV